MARRHVRSESQIAELLWPGNAVDEGTRGCTGRRRRWAEFNAEGGAGVAASERELRENLIGKTAWAALEPTARVFIATAEKLFREHREDPAFDSAPVVAKQRVLLLGESYCLTDPAEDSVALTRDIVEGGRSRSRTIPLYSKAAGLLGGASAWTPEGRTTFWDRSRSSISSRK